ncbi:MAG: 5-methyltetrahydropteroyltriglutamate--homocysteine S-methyltransferase [Hyphomicrobiaceae bacterium]
MSPRTKPPFRAEHVGSLIRPDSLIKARQAVEDSPTPQNKAELAGIQQEAIRDVVAMQQDLGLSVVTDGEYNRFSWQRDFLLKIENVVNAPSKVPVKFHSASGTREHAPPTMGVVGKLKRPAGGMFIDDFKFLASIAKATSKVTFPSPTVVHFRGGRDVIDKIAYPEMSQFYADLARVYQEEIADLAQVGCRYIQIDEVNMAYLCDPELRKHVSAIGEDPEQLPHTYAKLINDTIARKPADMVACMHLCRGNFAGHWVAEGGYEPVAEVVFNEMNIDGYFLEYDSDRAGGFEPLRFLPKGKVAVLGLVTTKSPQMESKDDVKRRIEQAAKFVSIEQLALSPQCGFSSGIGGETMSVDIEKRKLGMIVEIAQEVWGSA